LRLIIVFNQQIWLFYLVERERMNGRWSFYTKTVELVRAITAFITHLVSFWSFRALRPRLMRYACLGFFLLQGWDLPWRQDSLPPFRKCRWVTFGPVRVPS
jgi:hypothetical protein